MASTPFRKRRWAAIVAVVLVGAAGVYAAGTREAAKAGARPPVEIDLDIWPSRKPLSNTRAYREAHGLVPGAANALRVGDVLFRFPPGFAPEPYSAGRIVRGQADSLMVYLDLSRWITPQPRIASESNGLVRIEIQARGVEDLARREASLAPAHWKAVREPPDLGMREYVEPSGFGGWGYLVYASKDARSRTPRGGPVIFSCAGLRGQEPSQCRSSYLHPSGPLITYYVSRELLPRWREVHARVVGQVDSFIDP